jgi:hypothetical protein
VGLAADLDTKARGKYFNSSGDRTPVVLKQIIKFDVAVLFSRLSHLKFLGPKTCS